jgi:TrmH family RNA methyltransferase
MATRADISLVRSLADRRARKETGLFVAEGDKIVNELAASSFTVRRIFAAGDVAHLYPGAEAVSAKELERMSSFKSPADVIAVAEIPCYKLPENIGSCLTLALDDVQDPGNLGTIIRLADWFGIKDMLCSYATADAFSPKVVQASMGSILRVRIHYCDLALILTGIGAPVYGTFMSGENLYASSLSREGVIVMGNEGKGISKEVERVICRRIAIPPYPNGGLGRSESLNVALATAIICSEFRRRVF